MRVARQREEPALRVFGRDLDLGASREVQGGATPGRVHAAQDAERLLRGLRAAVGEHLLHRPVAPVHVRLPLRPAHARVTTTSGVRRVRAAASLPSNTSISARATVFASGAAVTVVAMARARSRLPRPSARRTWRTIVSAVGASSCAACGRQSFR